jgi:phosphatidylserine/phosphatidylglycerophosphate/cardiolipin synthase-like enzyme
MPVFLSPVSDLGTWNVQRAAPMTLPADLRYAGYTLHGLEFTRPSAENVFAPCRAHVRVKPILDGSMTMIGQAVELDPLPMGMRRVLQELDGGVPTFYAVFAASVTPIATDGSAVASTDVVASADRVTIGVIDQSRNEMTTVALLQAMVAAMAAVGDTGSVPTGRVDLAALVAAIGAALTGPTLVLLDEHGRRVEDGAVQVTPSGGTSQTLTLQAADGGDLGLALARERAANPSIPATLLSAGAEIASAGAVDDDQWVSVDDPARNGARGLTLGTDTHLMRARLSDWFAAQFATPIGATAPALAHFSRGNSMTTFVNGPAYYEDLLTALHGAASASGGFHLVGYSVHPRAPLIRRRWNDTVETKLSLSAADERAPAGQVPVTIEQALSRIGALGGGGRILPLDFIQPNSSGVNSAIGVSLALLLAGFGYVGIADALSTNSSRTNDAGIVALVGAIAAAMIAAAVFSAEDFATFEPNDEANTDLNAVLNVESRLDALPVSRLDNPDVPASPGFPFDTLFGIVDRFGSFHQKIALVRQPSALIAYCGGTDINPDRLDDTDHLSEQPYSDTQVRIEGPAASDLAVTFAERWQRSPTAGSLAFTTPTPASLPTPGEMAVEVARTYPLATDAARRLDFAPAGDATLARSILNGIGEAREYIFIQDQYFTPPPAYRTALRDKVANREIKSLVITVPEITTQPFGIEARNAFLAELIAADDGAGIVQAGYMRRKYSAPNTTTGAMFGKLRLAAEMTETDDFIFLTPEARLPGAPFWLAVNGELMWVTGGLPPGSPTTPPGAVGFAVTRGDSTHLFQGPPATKGSKPQKHPDHSAATMVKLPGVYMHSKLMIVDDVFLSIGSANINRRGLAHDAECNIFTLPQRLRADPGNVIARFRAELTAELLDLPDSIGQSLLRDPLAAAELLRTETLSGNRFRPVSAVPTHPFLENTPPGGWLPLIFNTVGFTVTAAVRDQLFDFVVDPTTGVEGST